MEITSINIVPLAPLDQIFFDNFGLVKPLLSNYIKSSVSRNNFLFWCVKRGVYQYPTLELIEWLKNFIGIKSVIEIGCGHGTLARQLKIKGTDSGIQLTKQIAAYYALTGNEPTVPPFDVEIIEAIKAIKKYKPKVIFGCYITHKWQEGDHEGFIEGIDEEEILRMKFVEKYIVVGNLNTHKHKRILRFDHEELYFPWLISRSLNQDLNRIFIWDVKKLRENGYG